MRLIIIFVCMAGVLSCAERPASPTMADSPKQDSARLFAASHVMLSETQMLLGNITTQKVLVSSLGQTVSVSGKFVVDENYSRVISSRAAGRIEKLYVRETGTVVKQGQPLYSLYSEMLLTLQREYLLAKAQYDAMGKDEPRYENFMKAAERKLLLYGLLPGQIQQLGQSKTEQSTITFLAPASGVVTTLNAVEGQYVAEGSVMYSLDDLSHLWLEAELYPHETSLVRTGDKIRADIGNQYPAVDGEVIFLSPEFNAGSQITRMRAAVSNPDFVVKPGMQAQVNFTHSVKQSIAVPADAVIRDEHGAHVYVQSDKNIFQPRSVTIGLENFDQVEITSGLSEHETIAATGAYLLYSEFILKKGTNPTIAHHHQ